MASSPRIEPAIHSRRNIGQNINVFAECNEETNITQIIDEWFQQRFDYDFATRTCNQNESCINYLQVRELVTTNCMKFVLMPPVIIFCFLRLYGLKVVRLDVLLLTAPWQLDTTSTCWSATTFLVLLVTSSTEDLTGRDIHVLAVMQITQSANWMYTLLSKMIHPIFVVKPVCMSLSLSLCRVHVCLSLSLSLRLSLSLSLSFSGSLRLSVINTHCLLILQTTLRMCVLVLTHTLPFAYLKEVFSATLSRASITPPSTSSATSN